MKSRRPEQELLFLTPEELVARYRGEVTSGTLRNWRCAGRGPPFIKVGRAVLYPLEDLETWEARQLARTTAPR